MGMEGLEPSRSKGSTDFKSVASTNSATSPVCFNVKYSIAKSKKKNNY